MLDWNQFTSWFYLVFLLTAIPVVVMIVLEKRSPYKTTAWIMVLIMLPVFGVLFYLIFGQEYRKRKMFSRRGLKSLQELRRISAKQLRNYDNNPVFEDTHDHSKIIRLLLNNSNALLTTGNQLDLLKDGEQTFASLFEAIKKAKHHIHLEYYIFETDKIGTKLLELLLEKRKEGVEVRIIIDDVGSWNLKNNFYSNLRNQGIEIYPFMKVRFPRLTSKVNFRNHRKIAIIDGKVGFIGGINVADRYIEGLPKLGKWRDTHLKITGDAATSLQIIFTADWYFITGQNLNASNYLPEFTEESGIPVQISAGGPDYDWESIAQAYFTAITNARKKVFLVTPYLMPPPELLLALKTAALSGVDVRLIIPEKSDARLAKWCSFSYVEGLLESGVKIFFYQNGFIHSKYMLVDDGLATIGTSNLDFRSFETNFEANAFIYSTTFNTELERHFLTDQKQSRQIKLSYWRKRSWFFKLKESFAHIISPMF